MHIQAQVQIAAAHFKQIIGAGIHTRIAGLDDGIGRVGKTIALIENTGVDREAVRKLIARPQGCRPLGGILGPFALKALVLFVQRVQIHGRGIDKQGVGDGALGGDFKPLVALLAGLGGAGSKNRMADIFRNRGAGLADIEQRGAQQQALLHQLPLGPQFDLSGSHGIEFHAVVDVFRLVEGALPGRLETLREADIKGRIRVGMEQQAGFGHQGFAVRIGSVLLVVTATEGQLPLLVEGDQVLNINAVEIEFALIETGIGAVAYSGARKLGLAGRVGNGRDAGAQLAVVIIEIVHTEQEMVARAGQRQCAVQVGIGGGELPVVLAIEGARVVSLPGPVIGGPDGKGFKALAIVLLLVVAQGQIPIRAQPQFQAQAVIFNGVVDKSPGHIAYLIVAADNPAAAIEPGAAVQAGLVFGAIVMHAQQGVIRKIVVEHQSAEAAVALVALAVLVAARGANILFDQHAAVTQIARPGERAARIEQKTPGAPIGDIGRKIELPRSRGLFGDHIDQAARSGLAVEDARRPLDHLESVQGFHRLLIMGPVLVPVAQITGAGTQGESAQIEHLATPALGSGADAGVVDQHLAQRAADLFVDHRVRDHRHGLGGLQKGYVRAHGAPGAIDLVIVEIGAKNRNFFDFGGLVVIRKDRHGGERKRGQQGDRFDHGRVTPVPVGRKA